MLTRYKSKIFLHKWSLVLLFFIVIFALSSFNTFVHVFTKNVAQVSLSRHRKLAEMVKEKYLLISSETKKRQKSDYVFAMTICQGSSKAEGIYSRGRNTDISRQIEQAGVLIKSAMALTSKILRFIVLTDTVETYNLVLDKVKQMIPITFENKLVIERREVWYPTEGQSMKDLFEPCSSAKLFMPSIINDLDSIIYLDTDVIFLKPPEDLWNEFLRFNPWNVAGMAPCLIIYDSPYNKVPHYGLTGLNSGVLMMNLSRLGSGWEPLVLDIHDKFKDLLIYPDQDILNIMFSDENEIYVHEIGCDWNVRSYVCNKCLRASRHGVSLLHGTISSFIDESQPHMKIVFTAWKHYELGNSLTELYTMMENEFEKNKERIPMCSKNKSFADLILMTMKTVSV